MSYSLAILLPSCDAGFKVLIDHDVSKDVRHIGSFEFTFEHAEACKDITSKRDAA